MTMPAASPPRRPRPWTEEEKAQALALHDLGYPYTAIARRLGRALSTVNNKLTDLIVNRSIRGDGPAHQPGPRRCLCCGQPFPSSWIGHRVCSRCKLSEAYRSW